METGSQGLLDNHNDVKDIQPASPRHFPLQERALGFAVIPSLSTMSLNVCRGEIASNSIDEPLYNKVGAVKWILTFFTS